MQRLVTCLLIAGADRVLCHLVMFETVFFFLVSVQNEIQLLSRLFSNSWLVCLLRFLSTNAPLVKVIGNPISDGIVSKNELTHLPLLKWVEKPHPILEHLMTFRSSISTSKPEQLLSLMCFFFFRFPEVERMVYAA